MAREPPASRRPVPRPHKPSGSIATSATDENNDRAAGARDRAVRCARVAADNRGRDILVLQMHQSISWVDYILVVTGSSTRQLRTIADRIQEEMAALGDRKVSVEGYDSGTWIVLDYGDLIFHVFDDDRREYYQIEHLYADAPRVDWQPAGQGAAAEGSEPGSPSE